MALKVIKISQVIPSTQLVDPFILPLSFFDLQWLKLNHLEEVMFYKLNTQSSSPDSFYSSILPKLEQSLSLALTHFRPLTGHLKWEPQDPKPYLVVFPQDTLSFKVAESDADFSRLSSKGLRPELELHALVPELPVFPNSAPVFSLQVTLFPNQGFCIGTTRHHVAMDGKSYANFIKSWAYICQYGTIPKDIPTLLDRTVINVPVELEQKTIELMPYILPGKENARNLKLPPIKASDEVVRTTLELTQETIEKLKERAREESSTSSKLHLSTFVVTYAYVWTCMVKARGGPVDRPVQFMYAADYRERLDPPVPETYFGNCVLGIDFYEYEAKTFLGEDGFINSVHILSDSVKGLRSQGVESLWKVYEQGMKTMKPGTQLVVVTGSNQFGCYEADFGWGRPVHNEVLSIYQNDEFSMSKRRDHAGGVEIGISLKKSEMDVFMSLYENGLGKLSSKTSSGVQGGLAKEVHFKGSNLISLAS